MSISSLRLSLQSRAASVPAVRIPWKLVMVGGMVSLAALSLLYVAEVAQLTKSYYFLNADQRQISTLSEQNRNLQASFAENTFLTHILSQAAQMNFQTATNVQYVQVLDNSFAINTHPGIQ